MQIYILHGYVDGLTDPVVSTDYSIVYDAMKTAYEEAIDDAEQTPRLFCNSRGPRRLARMADLDCRASIRRFDKK